MDRTKSYSPFRLILAILACYRLALLVAEDDGPGDVFRKLRRWTDGKRKEEQQRTIPTNEWANIGFLSSETGQISVTVGTEVSDLYFLEKRGKWANIDDGIRCPYCVGVWAAALVAVLVYTGIGDFILLVLAIAGGQSVLQNMRRE